MLDMRQLHLKSKVLLQYLALPGPRHLRRRQGRQNDGKRLRLNGVHQRIVGMK